MKHRKLTPWTQQEKDEYAEWHEKAIQQYPGNDVVIGGRVYNIQRELREDRIKFLAGIPTAYD